MLFLKIEEVPLVLRAESCSDLSLRGTVPLIKSSPRPFCCSITSFLSVISTFSFPVRSFSWYTSGAKSNPMITSDLHRVSVRLCLETCKVTITHIQLTFSLVSLVRMHSGCRHIRYTRHRDYQALKVKFLSDPFGRCQPMIWPLPVILPNLFTGRRCK